jgi:hypothetical protein
MATCGPRQFTAPIFKNKLNNVNMAQNALEFLKKEYPEWIKQNSKDI